MPGLTIRPLVRVGEISYGLYVWMAMPVAFLWPLTSIGYFPAMVAVWVVTFALALVSERWIERPWRKPRSAARAVEPIVPALDQGVLNHA